MFEYRANLLQDDELIARAYTEYVVSSNHNGVLLEQFKNDAILSPGVSKYFNSINSELSGMFDELLKKVAL